MKLCSYRIRLALLSIVLKGCLLRYSQAEVKFEFAHWMQHLISRTDNLTILNSTDVVMWITCMASYPVEWVINIDDVSDVSSQVQVRFETTDRRFEHLTGEHVYNYKVWIQLQYAAFKHEQHFLCRAVADPDEDRLLLKFRPVNGALHITQHPKPAEDEIDIGPKPTFNISNPCPVEFSFVSLDIGYYWKCQFPNGTPGMIKVYTCHSAAFCANTFREVKKLPSCLKLVNSTKVDINDGWNMITNTKLPGVAVCPANSVNLDQKRVIEFFFSAVKYDAEIKPLRRQIHFSWNEINPVDMIWMDPPVTSVYYTLETLQTTCSVPTYGFSYDPLLVITLNGSRVRQERQFGGVRYEGDDDEKVLWTKNVTIIFGAPDYGPGIYTIQCIAPVWNSTEWANLTKTITVKDSIPPYFDVTFENITLEDGATNVEIICLAKGDPFPKLIWDSAIIPGTTISDDRFIFRKVTGLYADGNLLKCTATNKFGQIATKEFQIHVKIAPANPDEPGGIGVVTISIIVAALIFGLLLVCGLLYLYSRFLKLGNQVTTFLTSEEIKEFKHGKSKPVLNSGNDNSPDHLSQGEGKYDNEGVLDIECLPYNSELEVLREHLKIDFNCVLGSGEHGIVYKGVINLPSKDDATPFPVAVKTVKQNVHVNYFKALLSELKILAYIGHHENIVNLVGACTSNIQNRELYVSVELCKVSLLKFLQQNRNYFRNFVQSDDNLTNETSLAGDYQNASAGYQQSLTTLDLIRWSREIATGMEFLSKKKVIHADLATRNILISDELHAKICDFGLARQLVDYNYVKSEQCPLPWKWMAIESLNQMKFSSSSDVWAYGVTLWEVFSLGNIPYPGMVWSMDFVDQLIAGLRMGKPAYASNGIYNAMSDCWNDEPNERPTFTELKEFFQALQAKLV